MTDHGIGGDEVKVEKFETPIGSNELRTEEYGILKIKDEVSVDMALTILKSLKEKLQASREKGCKTGGHCSIGIKEALRKAAEETHGK